MDYYFAKASFLQDMLLGMFVCLFLYALLQTGHIMLWRYPSGIFPSLSKP
jgi:hypothetical protein